MIGDHLISQAAVAEFSWSFLFLTKLCHFAPPPFNGKASFKKIPLKPCYMFVSKRRKGPHSELWRAGEHRSRLSGLRRWFLLSFVSIRTKKRRFLVPKKGNKTSYKAFSDLSNFVPYNLQLYCLWSMEIQLEQKAWHTKAWAYGLLQIHHERRHAWACVCFSGILGNFLIVFVSFLLDSLDIMLFTQVIPGSCTPGECSIAGF